MKRLLLAAILPVLASTLVPTTALAQEGKPQYTITARRAGVSLGTITIELFPDIAPKHVRNFDSLVAIGFYDGTAFHRVIPGFMIQGGDPNTRSGPEETWGTGDPSQTRVPAEFNPVPHRRGIISAARTNDPNSATSQFFIVVATASHLDRNYSVYGRVIAGMEVVDTIVMTPTKENRSGDKTQPIDKITVTIARTGIDTTTPGAVTLAYPMDDTTRIATQHVVRWDTLPEAVIYEIQVSKSPDFATLTSKDSVSNTAATLRGLEPGRQQYYWRVRASNGGRRGPWSETRGFTTAIAKAVPLAPSNTATDQTAPLAFRWRSAPGAHMYRLQLSTTLGFTEPVVNVVLTDTTYTVDSLTPGARYYWRVFASDTSGGIVDSSESVRWNFRVAGPAGVESGVSAEAFTISIVAGSPVLSLTTLRTLFADIEVIDATGRIVQTIGGRTLETGRNEVRLDETLPAGRYFARIRSGDMTAVRGFVVRR